MIATGARAGDGSQGRGAALRPLHAGETPFKFLDGYHICSFLEAESLGQWTYLRRIRVPFAARCTLISSHTLYRMK